MHKPERSSGVETKCFPIEHLQDFTQRVFEKLGLSSEDAARAAEVLAASDVRGIDSHGVSRLPAYVEWLASGRSNSRPNIRIVRQTASTAQVDGDRGLGLVVGPRANQIAMEKAEAAGSGWVSVGNSNHFGIAGYYVLQTIQQEMIGWAMTNASPQVAPPGAAQRSIGTNPIAVAFPGAEEPPIVIDMATSAVAYGKIQTARRTGQSIPRGWALDSQGEICTDPNALGDDYALLPLGQDLEHGAHKGYCLATMVDMFCGVLSGAAWGPFTPKFLPPIVDPQVHVGRGLGHFFGAMRIDGFADVDKFKDRVDQWIRAMRGVRPARGTEGPAIPGDPERAAEQHRREHGVPLVMSVVESLRGVAKRVGTPFDDSSG